MKIVVAALATVALLAGSAAAQSVEGYNSGGVSFEYPGWVVFEPPPRRGEDAPLIAVRPADNGEPTRRCQLGASEDPVGHGRSQEELNAAMSEAVAATSADRYSTRRELITVDGVAVLEEEAQIPDRRFPLRTRTRHFSLVVDGRATMYLLFCAAVNEARDGPALDIDAVIESLHFDGQTPP